ncbi:MAG: hypothetical protein IKR13_06645 [Victivallales bacterium]|nr:hypothetical protein [Victivallales bacterium]
MSRIHPFTLMEVMIAALILAMSVAATTAIVGTARANMLREQRRWLREHLLTNAVEFYLACGPDATPPDDLLPEGYGCSCELFDVEELPEDALESIREWRLGEYHITVFAQGGDLIAEQSVRKILKEDDLGYNTMGGH